MNLYAFLVDNLDEDGNAVYSDAALRMAEKGVHAMTMRIEGEFIHMKFSSRRRLTEATAIARRFVKVKFDAEAELTEHDDYEFRGYFWMRFIDAR